MISLNFESKLKRCTQCKALLRNRIIAGWCGYQESSNLSGPQVIKVHTEVYTSVKYGGGKIDEEQARGAFSGKIR